MKIIVTGSESFVARELIRQCLKEGIEVVGFDFAKNSDIPYNFLKGDINDPNIADIFPEGADAIVHLAALSRDQDCAGKAHECFTTNVMGTLNLVRAAQAKKVKQFIFASSEWVYEKFAPGEEKDEESLVDIAGHTSEYALSKLVSEANLRQHHKRTGMPITVFRFAIIYGPRSNNWSALESVVSEVKYNDTVTLMRSLKSGRRFLHVSDIARGIRAAFGRQDFQIINLSADSMVTMGDIIAESEKLFNKKVKIIESNPNEINVRNLSNRKAKELLGWKPEVDLATGIKSIEPYLFDEKKLNEERKIAEDIIRVRLSQMMVNEDYKKGTFKVPVHLAFGHEAIAVAVSLTMEKDDSLLTSHRNVAYHLARLGKLRPILDEYRLQPTGLNGGQSGSMNLLNPEKGIPYTSSILGNQFSVATGLAMAGKNAGKKHVVFVLAGDGSMEEGSFYESLLMAQSMQLPVVFLVENNEWSMSTKVTQRRCPIDLFLLAKSFGIQYVNLHGNDAFDYVKVLKEQRDFAVRQSAPVCVEVSISTLGEWHAPASPAHPNGEVVNYHAGPAPEIVLSEWPIVKETEEDPVFVLTKRFPRSVLEEVARRQLGLIKQELV